MEEHNSKHFTEQKLFKDACSYDNTKNSSKAIIEEEAYELTLSPAGSASLFYKFRKFIETESAADCNWEETLFKGTYVILAQSAQESIISLTFTSKDYKNIVEYTNYVSEEYKDRPCEPVFVYAYEDKEEKNKVMFSENFKFEYLQNANNPRTLKFHEDLETLRMFRPDTEEAYFKLLTALNAKGACSLEEYLISEISEFNLAESLKNFENFLTENFGEKLNFATMDKARVLVLLARNHGNIYAVSALYNNDYKRVRDYFLGKGFTDEAKIAAIFRGFNINEFKHYEEKYVNLGVDRLAFYDFAGDAGLKQDWNSIAEHFLLVQLSEKERKLARLFQVPIDPENFVYCREHGIHKSYLHVHHPKVAKMSANYGIENFAYFYLNEDEHAFKKPEKFQEFISHLRKEFKLKELPLTETEVVRVAAELPRGKKGEALSYFLGTRNEILAKAEEIVKLYPLFDLVYVVRILNQFDGDVDATKKALDQL